MLSDSLFLTKQRVLTGISLLFIIPAGFYSKFYTGPAADWVNNSLGGFSTKSSGAC